MKTYYGEKNLQDTECLFFQKLKILELTGLQKLMHAKSFLQLRAVRAILYFWEQLFFCRVQRLSPH